MKSTIATLDSFCIHKMSFAPQGCTIKRMKPLPYNEMQNVNVVEDLARKDERVSVPFDPETYDRIEKMAEIEDRPVARQISLLVKAALELVDEQGFHLINGKLRRGTFEELDTDD